MNAFFYKRNIGSGNRVMQGFSLIELMVSLSVFSIVMVVSTGTLLTMIDVNAKAQALYAANSNLSFAVDSISREIRTGYNYVCDTDNSPSDGTPVPTVTPGTNLTSANDCSSGGNIIGFTRDRDGVRMGYRFKDVPDSPSVPGVHTIEQKEASGNWVPVVAEDIRITQFEVTVADTEIYNVTASGGHDTNQPIVDIAIAGYLHNGLDTKTDFNIQTHVVQRRLDL